MGYVVPTYKAPPGAAWFHFLHGNVPAHQIDFIYRPEVPQGPLTQQHFSHLARLVKYIEPRHRSPYAFAIGNLSRDDTQYEPGHGAVALIFGLRIRGAKDHAGRQDPPFCHSAASVNRHLDQTKIYEAAVAFYRKLLPDEESEAEGSGWYHTYVQHANNPDALVPLLRAYVADFDGLPAAEPSRLGRRWVTPEGVVPPKRVVIGHAERQPFEAIAACAARIAAVLVESDVRWTVISSGRDGDVPGGVSVRFMPAQEAAAETAEARVLRLEEVPEDAEEIAGIFGARSARGSQEPEQRVGWRQRAEQQAAEEIPVELEAVERGAARAEDSDRGAATAAVEGKKGEEAKALGAIAVKVGERAATRSRSQVKVLVGVGVVLALGGVVAAVLVGRSDPAGNGAAETGSAQPAKATSDQVKAVPTGMVIEAPSAVPSPGKMGAAAGSGEKAPAPAVSGTASGVEKRGGEKPPVDGGKKGGVQQKVGGSVIGAPLELKR